MTPLAIVEHLQVIEDDILSLLPGVESLKIDTCSLEDVETTLRHRMIPTVPLPTPTGYDPVVMKKRQVTIRHILRTPIRVHDA